MHTQTYIFFDGYLHLDWQRGEKVENTSSSVFLHFFLLVPCYSWVGHDTVAIISCPGGSTCFTLKEEWCELSKSNNKEYILEFMYVNVIALSLRNFHYQMKNNLVTQSLEFYATKSDTHQSGIWPRVSPVRFISGCVYIIRQIPFPFTTTTKTVIMGTTAEAPKCMTQGKHQIWLTIKITRAGNHMSFLSFDWYWL